MLKTVEGVYRDGQVHLTQQPQDVDGKTQVLVTFLEPDNINSAKVRQLIEQLETLAGLQQGFNELNDENTRPVADFAEDMKQKYGLSS